MKYILFGFFSIITYFSSLYFFYEKQDELFLKNFKNSIEHNDASYLKDYNIYEFNKEELDLLPDEFYDVYTELNYEWGTFKESIENIENHSLINKNSFYTNLIFYISKTSCYSFSFNGDNRKRKTFCVNYKLNDASVKFIEIKYL